MFGLLSCGGTTDTTPSTNEIWYAKSLNIIGWLICHFSTLKNSLTLAIACLNTTFAFAPRLVVIANLTPTLITYPSLILIASVNILYCERYVFKFLLTAVFSATSFLLVSYPKQYKFNANGFGITLSFLTCLIFPSITSNCPGSNCSSWTIYAFAILPNFCGKL